MVTCITKIFNSPFCGLALPASFKTYHDAPMAELLKAEVAPWVKKNGVIGCSGPQPRKDWKRCQCLILMQGLQVQSLHRCQPQIRVEWEKGRLIPEAFQELLALSLYTPSGALTTRWRVVSINSAHLVCGIFQVDRTGMLFQVLGSQQGRLQRIENRCNTSPQLDMQARIRSR